MVDLEKSKNENMRYTLIIVSAAILLCVAVGILVGRPLYLNMTKTNQELKEKLQTLEALETKLEALKKLEARQEELESKNALVVAAIPDDKGIPRLFYQFEAIAVQSGVSIDSVTESTPVAAVPAESASAQKESGSNIGQITPISYNVKAKTNSYENLKLFLARTESSLRILSVENISISASEGTLSVELKINTYKRG